LKSLSKWIAGDAATEHLQRALLDVLPETRMLVAIVEELPDDQVTVFVPIAPTPGVGFSQIVHIEYLIQEEEQKLVDHPR